MIWLKLGLFNAIYYKFVIVICTVDLLNLVNEFNFSFLTCSGHSFLKLRISFEYCKQMLVKLWNRKTMSWTVHIRKLFLIKVRIFWKGHKNLAHLPLFILHYLIASNYKWKMDQILMAFSKYLNFITNNWRIVLQNMNSLYDSKQIIM